MSGGRIVVLDLDLPGPEPGARIARAVDPERAIAVVAVSRDPALAAVALAAGADFALLPRDLAWLADALRREQARRAPSHAAGMVPDRDRLVVDVPPDGLPFEEFERRVIEHTLSRTGWNRSRAARELSISRPRLHRKIERYGIRKPEPGPRAD